MSPRIIRRRRVRDTVLAAALLAALTFALAGCGGDDGDGGTAKDDDAAAALAAAKEDFDAADGVHFTMRTDSEPDGDAVLGAEGDLTTQPAFEGEVTINYLAFKNVTVPVISVDDKVYVDLPLPGGYTELDPATVGAPDPADFIDPAKGISGLLLELQDPAKSDEKREGSTIVTTYTGTLAGDLVAGIIPSAAQDSDYETVVGIADDRLTTLSITGDFFDGEGDVTFDLVFSDYDEIDEIKAP